jgi:hypothetical protein
MVRSLLFISLVKPKENRVMKKLILPFVVIGSMAIIGCDKTVSSTEKKTSSSDGSSSTTEQKTVQHPDGTMTTEKQSKEKTGN